MRTKLERFWKGLSREQAAVVIAIVVVSGWLAWKTDAATWEKLAEADPTEVGLRVGLFALAVAGVLRGGGRLADAYVGKIHSAFKRT